MKDPRRCSDVVNQNLTLIGIMKAEKQSRKGIYIHIPFCVRKCEYCDFLSFPAAVQLRENYVQALVREIREWNVRGRQWLRNIKSDADEPEDEEVCSIFIGGGTPSILETEQIAWILKTVSEAFNVIDDSEITVECNPGTLTEEKLKELRSAGVNRLSIGLQSADEKELRLLGRIHDRKMFEEHYLDARKAGFSNINVDLMSALPGQSLADWERTLTYVLSLTPPPEHISAYSLIIEEGTPFFSKYSGKGASLLPDEDTERAMYHATRKLLRAHGYDRYEISNYARRGFECRHNTGYWERRPYLGFGLGAASCAKEIRWRNTEKLPLYLQAYAGETRDSEGKFCKEDVTVLTRRDRIEETVFLGLRMTTGIDMREFERNFDESILDIYGSAIDELLQDGLVYIADGRFALTEKGMDLEGYVEGKLLC